LASQLRSPPLQPSKPHLTAEQFDVEIARGKSLTTLGLMEALGILENNTAFIICDEAEVPGAVAFVAENSMR